MYIKLSIDRSPEGDFIADDNPEASNFCSVISEMYSMLTEAAGRRTEMKLELPLVFRIHVGEANMLHGHYDFQSQLIARNNIDKVIRAFEVLWMTSHYDIMQSQVFRTASS